MIYLQLFYNFFITGLFSIGGGLATLPFLYDLSDKTGWFTHAELANMLAVSESTPGAIGINMATYVGFETASLPGAVIATLGLIAPGMSGGGAFTEDGVFVGILCGGDEEGKVAVVPYSMIETEKP